MSKLFWLCEAWVARLGSFLSKAMATYVSMILDAWVSLSAAMAYSYAMQQGSSGRKKHSAIAGNAGPIAGFLAVAWSA